MKRILTAASILLLITGVAIAEVTEREITYHAGDTPLEGYLVYGEDAKGKRPGVLVVHEWWGLNDYARARARMLAELGYTALAVDMYGEGKVADHPKDAGRFADKLRQDLPLAKARFTAALEELRRHPTVDSDRIAAIGYCFGGGIVLEMARAGVDIAGVVSFHGSLSTDNPAEPGDVEASVLVFNGAEDPFVRKEQIIEFKTEMGSAGVDYRFVNYPEAKHSFTNPDADRLGKKFDLPLAYDPEADRRSWQEMQEFFDRIFE